MTKTTYKVAVMAGETFDGRLAAHRPTDLQTPIKSLISAGYDITTAAHNLESAYEQAYLSGDDKRLEAATDASSTNGFYRVDVTD